MRIRRKAGVREKLLQQPNYVINLKQLPLNWPQFFGNSRPIHAELGIGKGKFLTTMAAKHPENNYIGIELIPEVLWQAVEKAMTLELTNIAFLWMNIRDLPALYDLGKWQRLYLNFSDPWPKRRHEKRRLTHPHFLAMYEQILTPQGEIFLKTDNAGFFEYSLNRMADRDYRLRHITFNLHASEWQTDNVMTEYEEKFSRKGQAIYRLEAQMRTQNCLHE